MNISLPDALKTFVDAQVAECGYGTSIEYVRELIRKDQDRQPLRGLLVAGVSSQPAQTADSATLMLCVTGFGKARALEGQARHPARTGHINVWRVLNSHRDIPAWLRDAS